MLTDKITVDAAAIYKMFGVDLKPKWFPVFFVLSRGEAKTITSIAKEIGHSHPSVSNIIKEMVAKGLVKETNPTGEETWSCYLPKEKECPTLFRNSV